MKNNEFDKFDFDFARADKGFNKIFKFVAAMWIIGVVASIGFAIGAIYIIMHFVSKVW